MTPTILQALEAALIALECDSKHKPGSPVYDDLAQAIIQLKEGESIQNDLSA
jgi:hypothetical protein